MRLKTSEELVKENIVAENPVGKKGKIGKPEKGYVEIPFDGNYTIEVGGVELPASKYQNIFYDFLNNGEGNAVVLARAGSAKTTTCVNGLRYIPKDKKVLFLAFNNHVVEELSKKTSKYKNVTVTTLHKLGLRILMRNIFRRNGYNGPSEYKYYSYIRNNIDMLPGTYGLPWKKKFRYSKNVDDLVKKGRQYMAETVEDLEKLAMMYSVPLVSDECVAALHVMEWGKSNISQIDFDDMIWLPNKLNLDLGMTYDYIFLDEAQDVNIAQIELFKKCVGENTRYFCVGDPMQQIYTFAGSTPESFEKLCSGDNVTMLSLPVCYRCGKNILELAQEIVPDIEPAPDAIEGEVVHNVLSKDIQSGDMVLCRLKNPLMKLYMEYLSKQVKAFVRGKSIGNEFVGIIKGTNMENLSVDLDREGVFSALYRDLFEERNMFMINNNIDLEQATLSDYILNKADTIHALEILSKGLKTADELIERVNDIFLEADASDKSNGICLSTVHKAKGLEADTVYILCPSLMPSKLATSEWQMRDEEHLRYVAYTRAKKKLGFISETEYPPSESSTNLMSALAELNNIEEMVCRIYKTKTASKRISYKQFNPEERVKANVKPMRQNVKKLNFSK